MLENPTEVFRQTVVGVVADLRRDNLSDLELIENVGRLRATVRAEVKGRDVYNKLSIAVSEVNGRVPQLMPAVELGVADGISDQLASNPRIAIETIRVVDSYQHLSAVAGAVPVGVSSGISRLVEEGPIESFAVVYAELLAHSSMVKGNRWKIDRPDLMDAFTQGVVAKAVQRQLAEPVNIHLYLDTQQILEGQEALLASAQNTAASLGVFADRVRSSNASYIAIAINNESVGIVHPDYGSQPLHAVIEYWAAAGSGVTGSSLNDSLFTVYELIEQAAAHPYTPSDKSRIAKDAAQQLNKQLVSLRLAR